jgi:hypothetical protein
MKNYFKIMIAIMLLAATGCQTSESAQAMLQDENERRDVYNTILENVEMRNEMIAMMRERNIEGMMGQGGMMRGGGMMGDTTGMRSMNRQQMQARMQEMMAQCETDTTACNMMSQMMLKNRAMLGNMMQRMQQRGMMDADCYQQMMSQIGQ